MSYAFTQDVPIDAGVYRRILDDLGAEPPKGLIVHLAVERPEGGLRYIDVWESEAEWDRFAPLGPRASMQATTLRPEPRPRR